MKDEIPRFGSYDPNTKTSTGEEMSIPEEFVPTKADLYKEIKQLQAEKQELARALSEIEKEHTLEESKIEQLQAENERLKKIAACAYCGKEYKKSDLEGIAEHATSCEKNPLVMQITELQKDLKILEDEK